MTEIARRVRAYRGDPPMPPLAWRTVIVVDDGVATDATAHATTRAARRRGAARVVLAAPVIAASSEPELGSDFDDVLAVDLPEPFISVLDAVRRHLGAAQRVDLSHHPIALSFDRSVLTMEGELADAGAKRIGLDCAATVSGVEHMVDRHSLGTRTLGRAVAGLPAATEQRRDLQGPPAFPYA